ncbi:MAG: flagellar protein export ATPase FliI [Rhodospirillaceae bacterium]|nr:flagellar protein export ATPase FliI [Rhodospirillaceae bacterium]MBL6932897.1 flagellar protein export ATPase FliI [Rhodospirillales bacterium]
MKTPSDNILSELERLPEHSIYGRVTAIVGLMVEVQGVEGELSIGDRCTLIGRGDRKVLCEVVGFKNERAQLMPFGTLDGIGLGSRAEVSVTDPLIYPDLSWMGRVVNSFGEPVDGKGPLTKGPKAYRVHAKPPHAHERQRVGGKIDLGIRALNSFLTCCRGQRMGIFAGSGVGKSTVMSMMARHTDAEVSVIGLIGERGREAREFIEDDLGETGMARSVVVVATSDEPPLVRRQAAYVLMAISEFFRDQQKDVLCLMDSVTRFAMAQREISLSAGEPPASKGYTPSVFAELPRLLERAGPGGKGQGSITGLFTVLVEGDDHNEPVADAVRGILDGHVVLDRVIAERGRYPAINILRSVSRTMPACNTPEENDVVNRARQYLATYEDMAELIRLGAYRRGSDGAVDEAIHYYPGIEGFLMQTIAEHSPLATCYDELRKILDMPVSGTENAAAPQPQPQPQPPQPQAPPPQQAAPVPQPAAPQIPPGSVKVGPPPAQPSGEQTLSAETLSQLNSLNQ